MIAALGQNRVIGLKNQLLWPIPDDLKRFKQLTLGHPVIMGYNTFHSILSTLGKPLPGRTNIVISDKASWHHDGAMTAVSIEDAIAKASAIDGEEIFIIGGALTYAQGLPLANRLYLTLIDDEKEGDAYFPAYEYIFTKKIAEEAREWNGLKYSWVDLEK